MKKVLLPALVICAVVAGGGYYFSVEKFAVEAENFKKSLTESKVFNTQSVTIEKYKFQITLDGISADLTDLTSETKLDTVVIPGIGLHFEVKTPIKLQYTPVFNKITLLVPDKNYDINIKTLEQSFDFSYIGDSGETVLHLSQVPNLKKQGLGNFLDQYVHKVSNSAGQFAFKAKNSEHPLISADKVHSIMTREQSDIGEKIVMTSEYKGLISDMDEFAKLLSSAFPEAAKTEMVRLYSTPAFARQKDLKKDSSGQLMIEANIAKIIEALKTASKTDSTEDLFNAFMGANLSSNTKEQVLGSAFDVDFKIQMPKSDIEANTALKYHIKTIITPQFQDFLVKAVLEKTKEFQPDINLTKEALTAVFPDLVSLGEIIFNLDAKGDIAKKTGNAQLDISALDYGIHARVDADGVNAVLKVIVHNYQEFISTLQHYIVKVIEHPEITQLIPLEIKTSILAFPEMLKATLHSMGKEETIKGKQAMNIEITLPIALATAMIASEKETSPIPEKSAMEP